MTNRQILLAILAFVALTFGSFIWFVATWSPEDEPSLSMRAPLTLVDMA